MGKMGARVCAPVKRRRFVGTRGAGVKMMKRLLLGAIALAVFGVAHIIGPWISIRETPIPATSIAPSIPKSVLDRLAEF